jgi:hypothetical protein
MAKEWANKDRYHPSHGVPEPRVPLPNGKGFVRSVLAWGIKSGTGGRDLDGRVCNPVRPVCNPVRPVCNPFRLVWGARTERPVRPIPKPLRLVWRQ